MRTKAKEVTKQEAFDMRGLRKEGWSCRAIGKKYDVNERLVSRICRYKAKVY